MVDYAKVFEFLGLAQLPGYPVDIREMGGATPPSPTPSSSRPKRHILYEAQARSEVSMPTDEVSK
jgi:hypothetical protein